jgi:hypothetical protein
MGNRSSTSYPPLTSVYRLWYLSRGPCPLCDDHRIPTFASHWNDALTSLCFEIGQIIPVHSLLRAGTPWVPKLVSPRCMFNLTTPRMEWHENRPVCPSHFFALTYGWLPSSLIIPRILYLCGDNSSEVRLHHLVYSLDLSIPTQLLISYAAHACLNKPIVYF